MAGLSVVLSHALQELIARSGYSYRELGVVLGLNIGTISQVVQGKRRLTRDAVIAFAVACGGGLRDVDALLRLAQYPALMGDGPASLPVLPRLDRKRATLSRGSSFASLALRPIQPNCPAAANQHTSIRSVGTPANRAHTTCT